MSTVSRPLVGLMVLAALVLGGLGLLGSGLYGLTLFILFPVVLGALASWSFRPATANRAIGIGALTMMGAAVSLLMVGWEGAICIVMTLPLAMPLGMLGSLLAYHAESRRLAKGGGIVMMLVLTPVTVTFDSFAPPPVFEVRSAITIAAPPEKVWQHVVTFPELPAVREWFFRAGLAYPLRAHIEGSGPGAVRYCEFSTGSFVEPIEVWDEPRLLRFRVTENPAPMHEWSPYAKVVPRHLHGYLISKQGEFRLTPLSGNRTLVEGTTWYQHGLWPTGYWRWWSDAIIHRIHLRVLNHIRTLAEKDASSW